MTNLMMISISSRVEIASTFVLCALLDCPLYCDGVKLYTRDDVLISGALTAVAEVLKYTTVMLSSQR